MGAASAQFSLQINREWALKEQEIGEFVQEVALAALTGVVQMSPVGNPSLWKNPSSGRGYVGGRFRGNWGVSIGAPLSTVSAEIDPDGGATIARGQAVIESYPQGDYPVLYLQNNLPYSLVLETGHSTQAPSGMVGITVANVESFYASRQI